MYSPHDDAALPAPGFPIRRSAGQRLFSASPRLIAAVHVLHRLLVPRHPPRALTILTVIELTRSFGHSVQFSRSGERHPGGRTTRSLKTEQHAGRLAAKAARRCATSKSLVDVSGSPSRTRADPAHTLTGYRERRIRLPRKEVIQPHLPVRLPCYDFTPIAGPTFDGSFPCGLGHRLRVLPTFVV